MPSFKDRIKAAGKHIKPSTWTKPDPKGLVTAIREHIKPPPLTRPHFKGCFKAMGKPFRCMFRCVKSQKEEEDDCPGLPEVKISYDDEELPESLASRSRISLTDSESDACPAEADFGPRSDSLEGIPEMLEAESLPSLMENEEEEEDAGKGKDWEKDLGCHDPCPPQAEPNPGPASDSLPQPQVNNAEETIPETLVLESISSLTNANTGPCPTEADPGPRADRVPEPQERTSDEQPPGQDFHGNHSNPPMSKETLHLHCKTFPELSKEEKWRFADTIASKHLFLILEHFLKSEETACDELMYDVLASPKCNRNICLDEFIMELNASQIQDSEELPLAKVKALKGIRTIVKDHSNIQGLKEWLQYHLVTLSNVLVSQFQLKDQGTNGKAKTYLVPGEAIDILAILLQRLDLVHSMKCTMRPI